MLSIDFQLETANALNSHYQRYRYIMNKFLVGICEYCWLFNILQVFCGGQGSLTKLFCIEQILSIKSDTCIKIWPIIMKMTSSSKSPVRNHLHHPSSAHQEPLSSCIHVNHGIIKNWTKSYAELNLFLKFLLYFGEKTLAFFNLLLINPNIYKNNNLNSFLARASLLGGMSSKKIF